MNKEYPFYEHTKINNLLELIAVGVLIVIGVTGGIATIMDDVKN